MADFLPQRSRTAADRPSRLRVAGMWLALLGCLSCTQSGCMFRRMTIRSDPPGALVKVDGEEIGYTPASLDFTYYGTREIKLVKDGYETLTVLQEMPPPWYQRVPLDFFSDNLWPFKTTDRRDYMYTLQPQVVVPTRELLERGRNLRSEAQVGP